MNTQESKKRVQINYNAFRSFNFPVNGVEEAIFELLCSHYEEYENKEDIKPVALEKIYSELLPSFSEKAIVDGLAALTTGKGGNCLILLEENGVMPGKCFGIIR